MELKDAICGRKTIRTFMNKPIDKGIVLEIIEAALYAPSACNKQAWKFIIVDDDDIKQKFYHKHCSPIINNSPLGILVLYRNDTTNNTKIYNDHIQSAAAAIQNILLLSYEKGLASCWLCNLPSPKYIRKIFSIPHEYDVIAYIALGYAKKYISKETIRHYDGNIKHTINRKRQYSIDQVVSYNVYKEHYNLKQTKRLKHLKRLIHMFLCNTKNKNLQLFLIKIRDFF